MLLYNSLTRKKEEFVPLEPGKVGIYTCGPTVYNYAHIGNLRTYVFADVLRRAFEFGGYDVKQVMNVTDVGHLTSDDDFGEDKMEAGAKREGKSIWDIARFYEDTFFADTERLNILRPTIVARATEHIDSMIALVERLMDKGYAYETAQAIYFDVSRFPDYTKLAGQALEEKVVAARAEVQEDPEKRNPADFALWFKAAGRFENHLMQWPSPWGSGFPGWHVECSAMSMQYLGDTVDIHTGGVDHIAVHHTNEIAQSEAATGKQFVRHWLHGEFLIVGSGEKMAKSAGEFLTLQSLIDRGYDPMAYRFLCLQVHYRSKLNFTWDSLDAAKAGYARLLAFVQTARRARASTTLSVAREDVHPSTTAQGGGAAEGRHSDRTLQARAATTLSVADPSWTDDYAAKFREAVLDDLNMPRAVAVMWDVVREANTRQDFGALDLLYDFDRVLGLRLREAAESAAQEELEPEYAALISEREQARAEKNWARADEIRKQLAEAGIVLKDVPGGTEWSRA